ncbi:integrase [Hellea sp.]|nr:integrase [Hellea sp.]
MTIRQNHYLEQRGHTWYYVRRVPSRYQSIDKRRRVKKALHTDSLTIAREMRDRYMDSDEHFWETALAKKTGETVQESPEMCRYRTARRRAVAVGFDFKPFPTLLKEEPTQSILERMQTLKSDEITKIDTQAVLGTIEPPKDTIRDAFKLYCDKLSIGETSRKSPEQIVRWKATKTRAVEHFVALCGNLTMDAIARKHGRQFYDWWGERLRPQGSETRTYRPNSANRELGNLRQLFREYWTYQGEEDRENPFRKLRFKDTPTEATPSFANDWVQSKILKPNVLDGINAEAQIIAYALIETGCRPSEIANLLPENICLDADVPHIRIRPTANRELKSMSSARDIPLVGVSLEAMKRAPNGFPRYRDKGNSLSAALLKTFHTRGLMPTKKHRIYSFRHAFEKRMQEAGLDYGLRCTLMGHKNTRPQYGDGGSLEYRRKEMLKIAHPVSDGLTQSLTNLAP